VVAAVNFFTKIKAHKNAIEWAIVVLIICAAIYSFGVIATVHIALSLWASLSFFFLGLWLSLCFYYRKFKLPIFFGCAIAGIAILPFLLFTSWYKADYRLFAGLFFSGTLPIVGPAIIALFKAKE
jgi:hypothetical protein